MTSNIGSQYIQKMESIGFSDNTAQDDYSNMKEKIMERMKDHFRPEFLNRLDEIIIFDILSPKVIRDIVSIRVNVAKERLFKNKGIKLDLSDKALAYLAKEGYNPQFGARLLNRLIQSKILNPVASYIIGGTLGEGDTVSVDIKGSELVIETHKKRKAPVKAKRKRAKATA